MSAEPLTASDLFFAGDVIGAALREAAACDRDGYDVTAAILRTLVEMIGRLASGGDAG